MWFCPIFAKIARYIKKMVTRAIFSVTILLQFEAKAAKLSFSGFTVLELSNYF